MPDDINGKWARQIRRQMLALLILGWAATIGAIVAGDRLAVAVLLLLGPATFTYIKAVRAAVRHARAQGRADGYGGGAADSRPPRRDPPA